MSKQRLERSNWFSITTACVALSIGACDAAEDPDSVLGPTNPGVSTPAQTPGASSTPAPATAPATGGSPAGSPSVSSPSTGTPPTATADAGTPPSGATGIPTTPPATSAASSSWCQAKVIFDKNCIACHDGKGSSGTPMGLTKYEDYVASAPVSTGKKVYEAIGARLHDAARPMPPKGNLSTADLALLDAWIKAGAPAGDPTKPCVVDGVREPYETPWPPPGGCDATYKITAHGTGGVNTPYVVPPRDEIHPQVQWDAPWGNEKVQAIAFRPITDNKLVLHHWILYSNAGNSALGGGAFLTGWAPGDDERPPMPEDVGLEMPTGPGSLRLDMHYNSLTATKSENDQSGVEVCVVKGARLRKNPAAVTMSLAVFGFPLAPANRTNYEATSVCNVTASKPVHIMTAAPHAHRLAVRTKFSVKKKNGTEIVMLDHPFIYGEQGSYGLENEVIVETGDKITTTCVYTNTTNQNVNFGPNTADEMCFNFAMYYPSGAFSCGSGGLLGGLLP